MKILKTIVLILLIGLGLSSGAAKIMLIPGEMAFFKDAGFSKTILIIFGAIQLISSGLLIFKKLRNLGALILALTFFVSSVFIFLNGSILFGFFSILPILLLGFISRKNNSPK